MFQLQLQLPGRYSRTFSTAKKNFMNRERERDDERKKRKENKEKENKETVGTRK